MEVRHYSRIALYAAMAALLFWIERWLPSPAPWVRLGLANVVTLIVLVWHGWRWASIVVIVRLLLGGFFSGTLFAPQFLLASGGSAASLGVMALAWAWGRRLWSPVGLSVLGAVAHTTVQLLLVASVLGGGREVFGLLPLFWILSVVSGCTTGWAVSLLLSRRRWLRSP